MMDFYDRNAYMLPKEHAATVMARDSIFSYHVIPDRSTNELMHLLYDIIELNF